MAQLQPRAPASIAVSFAALAVGLAPASTATAGNTEHPRTPVVWPETDCIHTVERGVDPQFEFTYAIPFEDTLLTIDEFEDSRTHQFIGFCRQWPAGQPPPRYVSLADLERSITAGFEDSVELDDPEATLETSLAWADCWTRITADDDRRPITHAAASEPVVWQTDTLAPGTWLIAGYTWEPPYNLWSRAPWVVRVLDDVLEPAQAAATMANTADALYGDDSLDVELCVDAGAGATVTLEWAWTKADPPEWQALESATVADAGLHTLSLPLVPPESSWGKATWLRARVEPPGASAYAAHALAPVIVFLPAADDDDGDDPDSGDGSEPGDESESGDESGDEGSTGSASAAPPSSGGCAIEPARSGWLGALVLLGLVRVTRRRRLVYPDPGSS